MFTLLGVPVGRREAERQVGLSQRIVYSGRFLCSESSCIDQERAAGLNRRMFPFFSCLRWAALPLAALASCTQTPAPRAGVWTNSLGMEMVAVPVAGGRPVRMACVETQERDLAPFRRSLGQPAPMAARPAARVSWTEAQAFCAWLTQRERQAGLVGPGQRYRLPTDHEWSCAVGLGELEKAATSVEAKSGRIPDHYPWGGAWPPPAGAGNLCGRESCRTFPNTFLADYRDDWADGHLAARASAANALGLHDLSGSLWEWCEDRYREGTDWRVLRGGSWKSSRAQTLLSSHRTHDPEGYRSDSVGFRCVLVEEPHISEVSRTSNQQLETWNAVRAASLP